MDHLQNENEISNSISVGHDGKPWPQTMDANAWATEFCKLNSASDHGTMLGWFANAIMIGYDTARGGAMSETEKEAALLAVPSMQQYD